MMGAGTFVVSIDVEMAWGRVHHGKEPGMESLFDDERGHVAAMLDLMARHEISSTWAIVGHLFLEQCTAEAGVHHPEIHRAPYPWFPDDWFHQDPASTVNDDPAWYAPDLVAAIRSCTTPQEIGSHSFSHQIIGDPACSHETFSDELTASHAAAGEAGVQLRSFVYPRNSIGHRSALSEHGFVAYRGPRPPRFEGSPRALRWVLEVIDSIKPLRQSSVRPSLEEELCNIPQTYLFDPSSRAARLLGRRLWSKLISRRLRQAARTGSLFHLWFHSHDIARSPDRALASLDQLFSTVAREREAGRLDNMTMGEVADSMRSSPVRR